MSDFYLRAFCRQPAALTNHQEYYRGLQKVLGVPELLDEVRQATGEIDSLMSSFLDRLAVGRHRESTLKRAEQHNARLGQLVRLIAEQEKSAKSHFVLTLVVESVGIPYYTFNFLEHAFHVSPTLNIIVSAGLTLMALAVTVFCMVKKSDDGS